MPKGAVPKGAKEHNLKNRGFWENTASTSWKPIKKGGPTFEDVQDAVPLHPPVQHATSLGYVTALNCSAAQ